MAEETLVDLTLEGVVHDLNNVFQTVSEAAYLVSSDPKWASVVAILNRSVERGQLIIRCLGEGPVASCDLNEIVAGATGFAGDVFQALRIAEVEFHRDIEPGLRLRGTPGAWERVLLNLLLNAGEAMQQGGIVEIRARRAGDQVEIMVADNGPGIPEEVLPFVFRPNFSTRQRASGMGLHIVEDIVQRNGGTVSVTNRSGGRAEFRITAPA